MIFWTTRPHHGTPDAAIPLFPWSPDHQRGHKYRHRHGVWDLTSGLASACSGAPERCSCPPAQQAFILLLGWHMGLPLGTGCSEEVSTGCPVRVFALTQGELPDHKGYQVGVGWLFPWRSPTQRDKHPRAGLALRWPQEVALEGPREPAL